MNFCVSRTKTTAQMTVFFLLFSYSTTKCSRSGQRRRPRVVRAQRITCFVRLPLRREECADPLGERSCLQCGQRKASVRRSSLPHSEAIPRCSFTTMHPSDQSVPPTKQINAMTATCILHSKKSRKAPSPRCSRRPIEAA